MFDTCYLRYLGSDKGLQARLAPFVEKGELKWKIIEDVDDLLDDCQRLTLRPELNDKRDERSSLVEAYAPVILDLSQAATAAPILREVKAINRGIPVIILCEQASLTAFSLALLDGSEALFHKPLASLDPLWEAIARANRRVQHWISALENSLSSNHA